MRLLLFFLLCTSFHVSLSGRDRSGFHFKDPQESLKISPTSPFIKVRHAVHNHQWKKVYDLLHKYLPKHSVRNSQLDALAEEYPLSPFARALFASKKILALPEKTGLQYETIVPIALFAETFLHEKIARKKYIFPQSKYGRLLQYDPQSKKFFIHLETHGVKPIGFGKSKIVTKTILYHSEHPEVMAHGVTAKDITKESNAMRDLAGVPCLLQAEALLSHRNLKSKKKYMATVTKIFRPGSLQSFLDSSFSTLTLVEKITIASNLVTGLAGMHEHGYVHRDLGAKNHFINIVYSKKKKRTVSAVIADFGRTIPAVDAAHLPVQGNAYYLSPEGFFRSKMHGNDYYASDVFAVGCVLWQVRFGKHPAWSFPRFFKKESWSLKKRYHAHLSLLNKTRAPYIAYLQHKTKEKIAFTPKDRFLALILQMTHPKAKLRGTASSLKEEFDKLLSDVL